MRIQKIKKDYENKDIVDYIEITNIQKELFDKGYRIYGGDAWETLEDVKKAIDGRKLMKDSFIVKVNGKIPYFAIAEKEHDYTRSTLKMEKNMSGIKNYTIEIELEDEDKIVELEFSSLEKAINSYKKYSKSNEYNGKEIADVSLIKNFNNGDSEPVDDKNHLFKGYDDYANGGGVKELDKFNILIITMDDSRAVNKVDKVLDLYGIKIANTKEWHTKGYGVEYTEGGNLDYPFTYVVDRRDAKNPKEFDSKLNDLISKTIDVTGMEENPFEDNMNNNQNYANGGFTNDVYADGGEIADIQKMKKTLIAKAKSRGIYENFGQKEVRVLEDKYGYTNNVRDFDNWAMNFDLSQMANGGSLMEVHNGTAFMDNPIYADNGLMLDNNDGFMKADNNRNFRYPEKEVVVEILNEDIDLNDNVSYFSKEVYVQPLSEDIDINEIGRVRAKLGYVDKNRTPAKLLDMNPRAAEYVVIDEMADGGSVVHYPSFKISKGTPYLDSFLNPGYYSYLDKERGGKGVYMNVMNKQIMAFSIDDLKTIREKYPDNISISLDSMAKGGYLESREEYEGYNYQIWYSPNKRMYSVSDEMGIFKGDNNYFKTFNEAKEHAEISIREMLMDENQMAKGGTLKKIETRRYKILGEIKGQQPVLYASTNDRDRIKYLVNMAKIDFYQLTGKKHRIFVTDEVTDDEVFNYDEGGRVNESRLQTHRELEQVFREAALKYMDEGKVKLAEMYFDKSSYQGRKVDEIEKELSDFYWQEANNVDEEINSDRGGETSGLNFERIEKLEKERDKYRSLAIKYDIKMAKGGSINDDSIIFSIDDEKLDMLLHDFHSRDLDYVTINGDEYYKLNRRDFDRFIDAADSTGFDVDYENSEDSVVYVENNYAKGGSLENRQEELEEAANQWWQKRMKGQDSWDSYDMDMFLEDLMDDELINSEDDDELEKVRSYMEQYVENDLGYEYNEEYALGGGFEKQKRKKFVLYTNPNNVTNKAYVAIGENVKDVLKSSRQYPDSYDILYQATGTNEDLERAKSMFSNYSFNDNITIMAQGGEIEDLTKLNKLEDYVYENMTQIKDNQKDYGFENVYEITNPYDFANLLGVDSRIFRDADIKFYAEYVAGLLEEDYNDMANGGGVGKTKSLKHKFSIGDYVNFNNEKVRIDNVYTANNGKNMYTIGSSKYGTLEIEAEDIDNTNYHSMASGGGVGYNWSDPRIKELTDKLSRENKNDVVRVVLDYQINKNKEQTIDKLRELGAKYSRENDNETARNIVEIFTILQKN
jgi:hypothetical protein